jgi:uncharacterized protein YrrD
VLKRILIGILKSVEATGEKAKDPNLKSRYFRLPKEQLMQEISSVLKKMRGYKVLYEAPNVGEIVVEKRTALGRIQDVTITVIGLSPVKSSVDIYSASRGSFGDLGSNYRTIVEIFGALERSLAAYKEPH